MQYTRTSAALAALVCALGLGLSGCGGGGGGDDGVSGTGGGTGGGGTGGGASPTTPTNSGSPEGFWCGTDSNGYVDNIVVLSNGTVWGIYASGNCNSLSLNPLGAGTFNGGAFHGSVTSGGNGVTGTVREFYFSNGGSTQLTVSGTALAKDTLNITLSDATTLRANYSAQYDQPATLAAVAGTYSGPAVVSVDGGLVANVTISAGGAITMPADAYGCSATGTIAPHGSVGLYDVSVTFHGAACSLGNGGTATGIAVLKGRQLQSLAVTSSGLTGFFYVGNKQ